MTMKEIAKKLIASINPGNEDISDIGSGTIKGAIRKFADGILSTLEEIDANTDETAVAGAPAVKELNKKMGDCEFSVTEDGAYVTYTPLGGADPVSKKLGSVEPITIASAVGDGTYSVVDLVDGYENLTADNFVFVPTTVSCTCFATASYTGGNTSGQSANSNSSASTKPTISYDTETGDITLSGCSASAPSKTVTHTQGMTRATASGSVSVKGNIICYPS